MAYCLSYCQHGGCCVLEKGHAGLHDSRFCTWTDAEALSKEAADQVFLQKMEGQKVRPLGEALVIAEDILRKLEA